MSGTLEDYAAAVNHVISICRDAEQGFRGAANAAKESELKDTFEQYSVVHGGFAAELQEAVKAMGFDSTSAAGAAGVLYAGWILVEAERCEEWCVSRYQEALAINLPVGIRSLLEVQSAATSDVS
jgi:hypothetical protein